jgi:hypothetical protein
MEESHAAFDMERGRYGMWPISMIRPETRIYFEETSMGFISLRKVPV